MSAGKNKRLRQQAFVFHKPLTNESPEKAGSKERKPGGVSIHRQNKMFSRNLSVPDFV